MSAFLTNFFAQTLLWIEGAYEDYRSALLHPDYLVPSLIVLMPFLIYGASLWGKRQMSIRHSTLIPHQNMTGIGSLKTRWSFLLAVGFIFLGLGVGNLNLAAMQPQVPQAVRKQLMQTRNICAAFDSSGSMETKLQKGIKELGDINDFTTIDPNAIKVDNHGSDRIRVTSGTPATAGTAGPATPPKDEEMTRVLGAQMAARYLVHELMTPDMLNTNTFCMYRFDTDSYILAPLTTDQIVAMLRTKHITENVGGGTNFAGVSDSGIGILQKLYDYYVNYTPDDSVRVEILITDGYDSLDPQRRKDLIQLYKDAHIHFYVIGLGEGWEKGAAKLDLELFANELQAADPHSGFVFRASEPGAMREAMKSIASIEKSQMIVESVETYRDVDYVFVVVGIGFIFMFFGAATLARRFT
jgi:hypothetical protein